jgi:glycosyltransferase involved in cell wall biosynthesis
LKILIVHQNTVPVFAYGGTERVVWDLTRALVDLGHSVTLLVKQGSYCDFAKIVEIDDGQHIFQQISRLDFDIVHFQFNIDAEPSFPYLMTEHGNSKAPRKLPLNTVFVSKDHAHRYGGTTFVHNGLDWSAYGKSTLTSKKNYFHFLGHGAWRVKNLGGAIKVALEANKKLEVLGGKRFNLSRGIRLTFSPHIHFHGMVGGKKKLELLQGSQGLIFPVRWHEPFGLAVIESMYMGCPVYGTPYGALPEIVSNECGYLASSGSELVDAINNSHFDPEACHERAKSMFNHIKMGQAYAQIYKKVVSGEKLQQHEPILLKNGHQLIDWSM